MNIITNIESVEELNEVAYTPFTLQRNDLIKFTTQIAYVVNNKMYAPLRSSIKDNIPLEQLIVFNEENLSTSEVVSTLNANAEDYLFPFSRKVFYKTFLSEVVPTLADSIYELLKSTNRIIPLGSGLHKGYIIKHKPFDSMPTFETVTIDPESISNNLITSITSLTSYINDAAFFEEKIAQRDSIIQQLLIQLEQTQKQVYSAYQTTWR